MYKGGSHGDYHAFKSTSGASGGSGSSGGGYGCFTWVCVVVAVLMLINELCKLF